MTVVNAVLQGIFLGAFYAVLACGLSLMFGVMRIINLAHGDLAVLGAYLVFVVVEQTGASAFVAFAVALPAMIVLGYVLQLTVLERSLKAGILTPLLATFGLSIVVQNLLQIVFSPDVHSLGGSAGSVTIMSWQIAGLSVSALGIVVVVVAVLLFAGLQLFLSRTRAGWTMRATAEDLDAAELAGSVARELRPRAGGADRLDTADLRLRPRERGELGGVSADNRDLQLVKEFVVARVRPGTHARP